MPTPTATTPAACAFCAGNRAALHADGCPERARLTVEASAPRVTSQRPLAELRTFGLQPFAVWSYELAAYLAIPTAWARTGPAAIRQMATRRDRGARLTDRHGRAPGRTTRDLRVVWSTGMDTGLLRADAQPFPEACAGCGVAAHAGACPTPAALRRFRLTDTRTNEDVMGGPLGLANPYVLGYSSGVNADDKGPGELEIGESVLRVYALSGQKPTTYRLVRVEDVDASTAGGVL